MMTPARYPRVWVFPLQTEYFQVLYHNERIRTHAVFLLLQRYHLSPCPARQPAVIHVRVFATMYPGDTHYHHRSYRLLPLNKRGFHYLQKHEKCVIIHPFSRLFPDNLTLLSTPVPSNSPTGSLGSPLPPHVVRIYQNSSIPLQMLRRHNDELFSMYEKKCQV